MLLSTKSFAGYNVDASDGPVGTVVDAGLDDEEWLVRGVVIDTRAWIRGRDVLVPVRAVRRLDTEHQKLALAISRDAVDASPSFEPAGALSGAPATAPSARLRSAREVIGYHISARDETFGHLEDLLFDTETWNIRYLLIDTRNWWPGPPVLVGAGWVDYIDPKEKKLFMDTPAERIKSCPPYDPNAPLSRGYETALHRHYERAEYWRQ
jgi:PRC-barrel domain protein